MYFSQWHMKKPAIVVRQGSTAWWGLPPHWLPRPSADTRPNGTRIVAQLSQPWSNSSPTKGEVSPVQIVSQPFLKLLLASINHHESRRAIISYRRSSEYHLHEDLPLSLPNGVLLPVRLACFPSSPSKMYARNCATPQYTHTLDGMGCRWMSLSLVLVW